MENFLVVKDTVKKIRRFGVQGRTLEFKIKDIPKGFEPVKYVKDAITQIVLKGTEGLEPTDYVGFTFCSDAFSRGDGWIHFKPLNEITINDIFDKISSIYQSNSSGLNTETFCLGVTSVKLPVGKGRTRNYNTFDEECSKRRGIISINNKDNLCLPRALVTAKASVDKDVNYNKVRDDTGKLQKQRAEKLIEDSGVIIPENGCGLPELQLFQNHLQGYKMVVYQYGTKGRDVVFKGEGVGPSLNLLYHDGHYNVITSLTAAFCCDYYCEKCHIPYDDKRKHRCGGTCTGCQQNPACDKNELKITCNNCKRFFRGQICFDNHIKHGICGQIRRCENCFKIVPCDRNHICGEIFCKICKKHQPSGHLCYIQPDTKSPPTKDFLFIFYDLETRQDSVQSDGSLLHEPNLCVFRQCCDVCIESNSQICKKCGLRLQILKCDDPISPFVHHILTLRKKFKKVVVIAHNGGGFDHQFVLNYVLTKTSLKPELIMRGTKLISMTLGNVKFLDSLNYFPMALSKLPKAFGISEMCKGFFPHLFNRLENQNYKGNIPSIEFYNPDHLRSEDREKLIKWHGERVAEKYVFDFQKEIISYCISDVDILTQACLKFRQLMMNETNVCPFTEATTIASACNKVFRRNFLKPESIGIIPKRGYRMRENQSKIAIQWMVWEENQKNIYIQHAAKGSEAEISGVKVDGFCSETNQVFEFQGCYYHGCPKCFKYQRDIPLKDSPSESLNTRYEATQAKIERLKDLGYEVVEMWEYGSDVNLLYNGVRDKLRDPEREVRQHALRVLLDLIPVTQSLCLDEYMRELLPELVSNLSHSAPALRKSALDSLRKYLQYSRNCDKLLMKLISTTENNVIAAAPFLISSKTDDKTLSYLIDHLWIDLSNPRLNQEVTAKSLSRIRYCLGDEKFKLFVGAGRYNEIQRICDSFGIPGIYGGSEFENISFDSEGQMEDKVILETEITLKTGPAITMKIHEEGKSSSEENAMQNYGVLEVLEDDSEIGYYEKARRTPRKVRFGGESVKLRTPESDSSHNDEHKGTIRITVTDAISIKTKRSLIPIRISSLPSTPRKNLPSLTNNRLHKSTPNLGRSHSNSRIPRRKNSNIVTNFKVASVDKKEESKYDLNLNRHHLRKRIDYQNSASVSRSGGSISPIHLHKEIEVFHNLTRSPERVSEPVDQTSVIESTIERKIWDHHKENDYNNFEQFSESNGMHFHEKSSQMKDDESDEPISDTSINCIGSFQVCPESLKPNVKALHSITSNIEKMEKAEELISDDSRREAKTNPVNNSEKSNSKNTDLSHTTFQLWQKDTEDVAIDDSKTTYDSFQVFSQKENCQEKENVDIPLYENRNTLNKTAHIINDHRRVFHHNWPISSLISEEQSWNKTQALDSLVKMLKQPNTCETLEPGPAALLFEALFSCQQLDNIPFLADDALALMINGLRVEVLQKCFGRLAISLCKIGSPSGVSLALMIMKRCEAKLLQIEIINTCSSHKLREGALQILMAAARILPSSDMETKKITEFAASALRDRRRRVRHAALETLATLAPLSSNTEVSNIVDWVNRAAPDHEYLVQVVRTRLSRRQLPAVGVDGTVLYSTPHEQAEVEWLSQKHLSPSPCSSASSSTHSVNYWKHNSRHGGSGAANSNVSLQCDDGASGNQQIWAVDPSVFPRSDYNRNSRKGDSSALKPVYFLQPEKVTESGGRGHRHHDRGRSSSPHKPYHKDVRHEVHSFLEQGVDQGVREVTSQFKNNEGFRKSLSSEHLHYNGKPRQEPHSFSLSSGSSITSTGSSIKSSGWQREMRSGIPVPISSETKLRLRTNASCLNNTNVGPVIARRSAIGTAPVTPITPRLSPRDIDRYSNDTRILTPPPRSSGSESSGYFTPPSETRAFVKLDSEARSSDSEEKEESIENDRNNNSHNCLESFDKEMQQVVLQDIVKENAAAISEERKDREEEVITANEITELPSSDVVLDENITLLRRFSISSSKDISFTGLDSPLTDKKKKSKSSTDLQNFLPEIPNRKNACSAPPLKDELLAYTSNDIITSYEDITVFPEKHLSAESVVHCDEVDEIAKSPKDITVTRKLSKRLSRTPSRRSIKSTPRSVRDLTPKSSGIKPKESLQTALAQLNNQEWEVMIQGLQNLTKVARSHPEVIEANIHNVCISLARHIKNLRSQVARSACHTASEIFGLCRKGLDMELEEIAGPLLHRTADTNKFLRADANTALDVMCEQLPASRVIMVITSRGCNHQNNIVRSAAMRLMTNIVKKLGADRIFQMSKDLRDRVILAGANSLGDGSLDARNHGKILLSYLISHPQFQKVLLETVPQNTLRHIAKTLNSIKPHTGT